LPPISDWRNCPEVHSAASLINLQCYSKIRIVTEIYTMFFLLHPTVITTSTDFHRCRSTSALPSWPVSLASGRARLPRTGICYLGFPHRSDIKVPWSFLIELFSLTKIFDW
jgi:hypothetical protein